MTHEEAETTMIEMLSGEWEAGEERRNINGAMRRFAACKARGEGIGLGIVRYPSERKRRRRNRKPQANSADVCKPVTPPPVVVSKEGEILQDWDEGTDFVSFDGVDSLTPAEVERLVECIRTGRKVPKDWQP